MYAHQMIISEITSKSMSDQRMYSREHVRYNDGLVLQAITVECSDVVDLSGEG